MNEDILSRARLLAKAANEVADQMSLQVDEYKAVIQARKLDEAKNLAIENEKKSNHDKSRMVDTSDIGNQKFVKGAAICGSCLITTYEDIRPFAPRGSIIYIDGIQCRLKLNGEWSANRIELEGDYSGQTNLDANIGATITAEIVKKRSPKKNKAVPIASSDISNAVANLDAGGGLLGSSRLHHKQHQQQQHTTEQKKSKKVKPPPVPAQESSSITDSLSEYSRALLSGRQYSNHTHESPQSHHVVVRHHPDSVGNDNYDVPHTENTSHSHHHQFNSKPPLPQTTLTSFSNSSAFKRNSSPSARSIHSTSSKISSHSKQSTHSYSSQQHSHSPTKPTIPGSEIVATDHTLEPEQIQMLTEIDDISPEEQQRKRYQMNVRMADRGQQKALERVEQRRNLELLQEGSSQPHDLHSNNSRVEPSEEYLNEQRRLAFQRVAQKRIEEDRLIAEKLKREEEEKLNYKKIMKEKEEKLKQLTAQRVVEYKMMKREKEKKRKEEKQMEEMLKREREMECQSELYLQRLQQRMIETEARLQKQKKDLEERKYLEKIEIENKLSTIAAQRHRTKDIVTIPPPAEVDSDDKTRVSGNGSVKTNQKIKEKKKKKKITDTENSGEDQNEQIKVSINTKPAHFLPGIRTSTSEQSTRHKVRKNSQEEAPQIKIDRHKSADVYHTTGTGAGTGTGVGTGAVKIIQHSSGGSSQSHPPSTILNSQPQRSETADELDEYLSEDSLDAGKKKLPSHSNHPPRGKIKETLSDYITTHHPPVIDNVTVVSALTNDTTLHSFTDENGNGNGNDQKEKKKKKRKVWKMEPIPVRPYVQIPSTGDGN